MSDLHLPYDAASKTKFGTSNEAGARIRPKTPTICDGILTVLRRHPAGLTPDEIAARMGRSPFSVRPRCTELDIAGAIFDTGQRRLNTSGAKAKVYRLKQEG